MSVSASPASVPLGQTTTVTVNVTATSGQANDVFVNLPLVNGLAYLSVNTSGGSCTKVAGFVGCHMGAIAAGTTKKILITAMSVLSAGSRTVPVSATTSSGDTNFANNAASTTVTVTAGSAVQTVYSTGSVAIPLPDVTTTDIPLTVPDTGNVVGLGVRFRLNHTFDSDLAISLISPSGQSVLLVNHRGGGSDNFGSGANSCAGATFTTLNDAWPTPIASGTAPFAGSFKPEEPILATLANAPIDGVWKLRVADTVGGDTGTLGCFQLVILRNP